MQRCFGCMKEFGKEYDVCPYCGYIVGTEPEVKSHLIPGTQLAGRYVLGKAIGHGGFGITYIAWDNKIQKAVAIKEYFPNSFSTRSIGETQVSCYNSKAEGFLKEGIKKMLDEARRISRFAKNENIVDIYDFFEENNTAYIVMEYLEGKDLKKHLEENSGKLAPERAVEIILPVLNALEDMHRENIIHRDISPDNIFLCDNGKVKLLDFGSARLAVEDSDKSLSVMVKRGYAPKEQYASRSKQGPWTDVYAVCATLYKMITGELPAESTEREDAPLKSFADFGIAGYNELEKVVFKGLEVDIKDRIQTVSELKNGLTESVTKKPETIEETPKKSIATKPKKPKASINIKAIVAAAAAVVLVVASAILAAKFIPGGKIKRAGTSTTFKTSEAVKISKESSSATSSVEQTPDINEEEIYKAYLNSKEGQKLYLSLTEDTSDNISADEWTGAEDIYYLDIDNDDIDECFVGIEFKDFDINMPNYYFVSLLDIKDDKVVKVYTSDTLSVFKGTVGFAVTLFDGEYYISEASWYSKIGSSGTIYKYDGNDLSLVKSMVERVNSFGGSSTLFWISDTKNIHKELIDNSSLNGEMIVSEKEYRNAWNQMTEGEVVLSYGLVDEGMGRISPSYEKRESLINIFNKCEYSVPETNAEYSCRDYNNDGNFELLVYQETNDAEDGTMCGDIYYVTENEIKKNESSIYTEASYEITDYCINGRWFLAVKNIYATRQDIRLFTIIDDKIKETSIDNEEITGCIKKIHPYGVAVSFSAYDQSIDGAGHTHKQYYFYWDEKAQSFKEYGAIEISEDEFLKCEGAKEIFDEAQNKGYVIKNILYRGNGIINVNYVVNETECDNINLKLEEDGSITVLHEGYTGIDGNNGFGGVYELAICPKIAKYPDKFPV